MEGILLILTGEYIYSIAAVFSCLAFVLKNILWLRILFVLASIIYIVSGISLGITSMIGWNSAYLIINLVHIAILALDRLTIALPAETVAVYHQHFSTISTREFKKLITTNEFCIYQNQMIVEENEFSDHLCIILNGAVHITKNGKKLATLQNGDFVGEMRFLTREAASANAYAENVVQCAYWTHSDLAKLKLKNAVVYDKFVAIIGCDLVRKLNSKNEEPIDMTSKQECLI
ncbi:MAG: hypothetical protein ACI8XX_000859 [Polaribacter sp.]|jgi:hypothetical protein